MSINKKDNEQSYKAMQAAKSMACYNYAPYFGYEVSRGVWAVVQGCCNSWYCPRCGWIRAREEFARIVKGAEIIKDQGQSLYFVTVTCGGRGVPLREAEKQYLAWTKKLNDAMRIKAKREGANLTYVALTERQKRGHPHSHYLTTYVPSDAKLYSKNQWTTNSLGNRVYSSRETLQSSWLLAQLQRSGLGVQYDISPVRDVIGAAKYISKYMFKSVLQTEFPPDWKRVRYTQDWPKLPKRESDAMPLVTWRDWVELSRLASHVVVDNNVTLTDAKRELAHSDTIVTMKRKDSE